MIFKKNFILFIVFSTLPAFGMDYTQSLYQALSDKPLLTLGVTAAGLTTGYIVKKYYESKSPFHQLKSQNLNTLSGWQKACQLCMQHKKILKTPLSSDQFIEKIDQFCKAREAILNKEDSWVIAPNKITELGMERFYVQKIEVPAGTNVIFHGDIHGDITSFNAFLEFLKNENHITDQGIINPTSRIILLGDMVDRGQYGTEVIYKALDLQLKNPDNFFILRGNHEDLHINNQYGFKEELERKFIYSSSKDFDKIYTIPSKIGTMYTKLPVAAYLVSGKKEAKNAILCCHGGLEIGFDKTKELLDAPTNKQFVPLEILIRDEHTNKLDAEHKACLKKVKSWWMKKSVAYDPAQVGFLWSDFQFNDYKQKTLVEFNQSRGMIFPRDFTKAMLELDSTPTCKIRGIFRAHQHGPDTMPRILNKDNMSDPEDAGVAKLWFDKDQKQPVGKLWDGIVCTFCVSPHNEYYGHLYNYNFDSFGILTTAEEFGDWNLKVHRLDVTVPRQLD